MTQPVGAGLLAMGDNAVYLVHRSVAIASKPAPTDYLRAFAPAPLALSLISSQLPQGG
ncbi:hypothetical protein [Pseudomonas laurylsulfatiphila]|uniref:hypothetical protein n=1 Tax=Pseudomonas laurylsulfatiphila TaxID=2011015 RepID=UPI003D198710